MKQFEELKSEFIEILRDKSPCQPEYKKVLQSATQAELLAVIFNNATWCIDHKAITNEFLLQFDPAELIKSGLAMGKGNTGLLNSGDWNSGDWNSGAFCTDSNPKLILFDKECSMTVREWESHPACRLMNNINPNIWVWSSEMTEAEKKGTCFP